MQNRRTLLDRPSCVNDRFELVDLDVDQLERVLGLITAFGNDDRKRFADIADTVAGERLLQGADQVVAWREPHRNRLDVPQVAVKVMIETTPGNLRACSVSIRLSFPCGNGLRRIAAYSIPGRITSPTKRPVPRSSRLSSLRVTLVPT